MGLDTVELVMEVEESFGVSIPNDRACEMRTVGDLYSFLLDETRDPTRDLHSCLTASTFYALRRGLAAHLDGARSLRPSSGVDATLPRRERRTLWRRLSGEMGLRFPRLRRPPWLVLACSLIVWVATTVTFVFLAPRWGPELATVLALLMLVLTAALMVVLSAPFAVYPASSFQTYRGLVSQLVALNYAKLSERHQSWNPTDVWIVLQLIIVEQLGVKKEEVTPEANFAYDLGCG